MLFKRLRNRIKKDIRVVFERDPAARSVIEVIFCYSGLHAIWLHRISHKLYLKGWVLLPIMISNFGRFVTGIEIHPGATIGEGLFISSRTVSGAIRKLVTDGFVEKVGQDPVIYVITEQGKNIEIED